MSNSQTFEAEPFEIEATSTLPEAPSQPLLGCPDAVGDLGVLQSALALLTQRLNQSPPDRSRIHNARLTLSLPPTRSSKARKAAVT